MQFSYEKMYIYAKWEKLEKMARLGKIKDFEGSKLKAKNCR